MKRVSKQILARLMVATMVLGLVSTNGMMARAEGTEEKNTETETIVEASSASGNAQSAEDITLEEQMQDALVRVSGVPAGTTMEVQTVTEAFGEDVEAKVKEKVSDEAGVEEEAVLAYDITLFDENHEEWQPAETDDVHVQFVMNEGEADRAFWVSDDAEVVEEVATVDNADEATVEMVAEHFTIYATTMGLLDKETDRGTFTIDLKKGNSVNLESKEKFITKLLDKYDWYVCDTNKKKADIAGVSIKDESNKAKMKNGYAKVVIDAGNYNPEVKSFYVCGYHCACKVGPFSIGESKEWYEIVVKNAKAKEKDVTFVKAVPTKDYDGSAYMLKASELVKEGPKTGINGVWNTEDKNPPTKPGTYTFTVSVKAGDGYKAATKEFKVVINKATLTFKESEKFTKTYDKTAFSLDAKDFVGEKYQDMVAGSWKDENGDQLVGGAPVNAGKYQYSVYITKDADCYTVAEKAYDVKIEKATPTLSDVKAENSGKVGMKLKDVKITGKATGVDGEEVKGTFAWKDGEKELTRSMIQSFKHFFNEALGNVKNETVVFTPDEAFAKNYTTAEEADVEFEMLEHSIDEIEISCGEKTYNKKAYDELTIESITMDGEKYSEENGKKVFEALKKVALENVTYYQGDEEIEKPSKVGSYSLKVEIPDTQNGDTWKVPGAENESCAGKTVTAPFVIAKHGVEFKISAKDMMYTGEAYDPETNVEVDKVTGDEYGVSFDFVILDENMEELDDGAVEVGTYYVQLVISGGDSEDDGYEFTSKPAEFHITQADSSANVKANNAEFTGEPYDVNNIIVDELVGLSEDRDDYTFAFAKDKDGKDVVELDEVVELGTYYVQVSIPAANDNYKDYVGGWIPFEITEGEADYHYECWIRGLVSKYDGTEKNLVITALEKDFADATAEDLEDADEGVEACPVIPDNTEITFFVNYIGTQDEESDDGYNFEPKVDEYTLEAATGTEIGTYAVHYRIKVPGYAPIYDYTFGYIEEADEVGDEKDTVTVTLYKVLKDNDTVNEVKKALDVEMPIGKKASENNDKGFDYDFNNQKLYEEDGYSWSFKWYSDEACTEEINPDKVVFEEDTDVYTIFNKITTGAVEPGQGTDPSQGENPGQGTDPSQGENPGQGTNPSQGENPGQGTIPSQGDNPGQGTNPGGNVVTPVPAPTPVPTPAPAPTPAPGNDGDSDNNNTTIEEQETPMDETPEVEDDSKEETNTSIDEEDVAKNDTPDVKEKERENSKASSDEDKNIADEEAPLSDSPVTGDSLPIAWAGLGLLSLLGCGIAVLVGKKKQ